jgi:hypothetical protein
VLGPLPRSRRPEGEINARSSYDPSTLRDEDEIVDLDWLERTRRAMKRDA